MKLSAVTAVVGASVCLSCTAARAQNLIVNGDFEDPSLAGIHSDYTHTPGGNSIEGSWWVTPWNPGAPWDPSQHTPGGVAAMNANGDDSTAAGVRRVWYQTIPVIQGRSYRFSAWALGTHADIDGYSLRFDADDAAISGVFSPIAARVYQQHSADFVATGASVVISIKNVSGITFPNDFMLDDLTLVDLSCPADLNHDGGLDFFDVSAFLNAFSAESAAADFNDDGLFDFFDIQAFLAAFSAGCP